MDSSSVTYANNLTMHSAPLDFEHWCVEIIVNKAALNAWGANPPPIGFRVAMYDATNATWLAWPPASDPDIPDTWGQIVGGTETIPEGFSIGIVMLLSSTAVAVGFYFVRKRPKTKNHSAGKTRETKYTI